jgi:hypothetical protein
MKLVLLLLNLFSLAGSESKLLTCLVGDALVEPFWPQVSSEKLSTSFINVLVVLVGDRGQQRCVEHLVWTVCKYHLRITRVAILAALDTAWMLRAYWPVEHDQDAVAWYETDAPPLART